MTQIEFMSNENRIYFDFTDIHTDVAVGRDYNKSWIECFYVNRINSRKINGNYW